MQASSDSRAEPQKKGIDSAGVVREAMLRQLTPEVSEKGKNLVAPTG